MYVTTSSWYVNISNWLSFLFILTKPLALAFQTGPLSLCSNANSVWFFQTTRVLLRSILFNVADINTWWVAVKGGRSYTRGISHLPLADNIASLNCSSVRTSFEIGAFHLSHVSYTKLLGRLWKRPKEREIFQKKLK